MIHDETSITRQLQRERSFIPPYCPNESCKWHFSAPENAFSKYGEIKLVRFPYLAKRFQCKQCLRTFTASRFRLDYQQKTWGHNKVIFALHSNTVSVRSIARFIGHSEGLVRTRLLRMSRRGLLRSAKLTENLQISEPVVYDGLENFAFSQYQPNNINHLVGKNSLFTYDFNFCPLNRKGRMSERQKRRKEQLEKEFDPYPRDAIRAATKKIFARAMKKAKSIVLYSDDHYQYRRVLQWDMPKANITHFRVSSKIARNFRNHLFAVNNIDVQARHNLAAFKRETIAFSKHTIAMQEVFNLYSLYRNYMRPKFWGTHRSDPESSKKSPAMEIGVADRIMSFDEFFGPAVSRKHVQLNEDQEYLYRRIDPTSRQEIRSVD